MLLEDDSLHSEVTALGNQQPGYTGEVDVQALWEAMTCEVCKQDLLHAEDCPKSYWAPYRFDLD